MIDTPTLSLPMQAMPIDRSQLPGAAMTADGGVEADLFGIDFDKVFDVVKTVGDVVKTAAPIATTIGGFLSDRTLKTDITPVVWTR
ncbi:hypothetical protein [Pseudonocardia sp. D17]|jgi:hypothetical protein|uniref:hypothetical protein n=1 Tax=Pseudonocardia sp. D17 TaxID=882661 RepID=UPI002B3AA26C|nr:hypothetical protein PSD17_05310 [Pseudonocardia sp. D17]